MNNQPSELDYSIEYRCSIRSKEKKAKTKLSKISDIRKRIKYLGWKDGIIAHECANVKANGCAFIKQKRIGEHRKRKHNSRIGIKHCSGCGIVYEVVPRCGHTRSEFHIYKLLSSARKEKGTCPYCTNESKNYMIVQ